MKSAVDQFEQLVNAVNSNNNIPLPPTNPDGSFKTVEQIRNENQYEIYKQEKHDREVAHRIERRDVHNHDQQEWENEQNINNDMYGWKHKLTSVFSVLIPLILVLSFFILWIIKEVK